MVLLQGVEVFQLVALARGELVKGLVWLVDWDEWKDKLLLIRVQVFAIVKLEKLPIQKTWKNRREE